LSRATLSFFFTLHFVLPFVIAVVVFAHLLILHEVSRSSSVMIHASCSKIKFNPFFSLKDVLNVCLLWLLYGVSFVSPWRFGDPEN
jgi:quinol-cytochrome oxidoreductase complex cytochrome b subunit